MTKAICLALVLACSTMAQATFDLSAPTCSTATFPIGCGVAGDPEGISWNGVLSGFFPFGATVDGTANGLGFPCGGTQYARVACGSGLSGFSSPAGGPAPESPAIVQMYVPIPAGATTVSFCWDFYNNEGSNSPFNDGIAIDVIPPGCGAAAVTTLVYADTYTAMVPLGLEGGTCPDTGGSQEVAPAGPQTFCGSLGAYPAGSLLRVRCWNSVDNAVSGQGLIDSIVFGAVCPCLLDFSSPSGPGSLLVSHTPCAAAAGASYFMALTFAPGTFPAGWFFGLDIGMPDLIGLFTAGFPFTGLLDGTGAASLGPILGVPSGITFYAVSTNWVTGFGPFISARPPVSYTIP